jgi:hypothetical protein
MVMDVVVVDVEVEVVVMLHNDEFVDVTSIWMQNV